MKKGTLVVYTRGEPVEQNLLELLTMMPGTSDCGIQE
jgi:hypothetical protein